jgi:hypothetical protein
VRKERANRGCTKGMAVAMLPASRRQIPIVHSPCAFSVPYRPAPNPLHRVSPSLLQALAERVRSIEPSHRAWRAAKVFTIGACLSICAESDRRSSTSAPCTRDDSDWSPLCRGFACWATNRTCHSYTCLQLPRAPLRCRRPHYCRYRHRHDRAGCFDLLHHGHSNLLSALRQFGRTVVVGAWRWR